MPGKYTSSEEKARILAWRQEKVSIKEICARSRRAKSTVMKLLASAIGHPPNKVPKHRFGGGRKKKTSNATDTLIKREVQKNPRLTALELKNLHPELLENVAVRTIQHRLQKGLGLPSRKAAKKPLLTERMKKQRIAFARKYIHWTPAQWKRVMFSDESNFQVFRVGYIYPLDSQESDGGAIHRVSNYPDLLPEMPRYLPRYSRDVQAIPQTITVSKSVHCNY